MSQVSNFDVLKRMSMDNLDIRLSPNENIVNVQKVSAGTNLTIGVTGDQVAAIALGDLAVCLILFNRKQFKETKKQLESVTASISFTQEELEVMQSMLEVIVDGTGTYTALRLPNIIKVHTELLDTFSAAIGRKRER